MEEGKFWLFFEQQVLYIGVWDFIVNVFEYHHHSRTERDINQPQQNYTVSLHSSFRTETEFDMEDVSDDPDLSQKGYLHVLVVYCAFVDFPNGRKELADAIHFPSGSKKKNWQLGWRRQKLL